MLIPRNEVYKGKNFTITESLDEDGKVFKKIREVGTNRVYDGVAWDLVGYEKEYEELNELVKEEENADNV